MTARALHFERRGAGPPLVLLHGFSGSARSMAGVAAALEREYETIAPDLPGHGRSVGAANAGGYRFEECVDALAPTLMVGDDLAIDLQQLGFERAHLVLDQEQADAGQDGDAEPDDDAAADHARPPVMWPMPVASATRSRIA